MRQWTARSRYFGLGAAFITAPWGHRPRRLRSTDVLETLAELFVTQGLPAYIRSDNGPEFTAELMRLWLEALQVQTLFVEPGSPWENGSVESCHGKLRDELLDGEIFYTVTEAKIFDRTMAPAVQYGAAPQCAGISPTSARDHQADTIWRANEGC